MDADRVINELATLTGPDVRREDDAATALLAQYAEPADPASGRGAKPRELYRQEYIRCGKAGCKRCADAPTHGPYWYAYSREAGRLRKRYIGKERPEQP